MAQTRRLGPALQSHVDLMRDLSGDLMVCESRNKTNYPVWYLQGDGYEVRITEWRQIGEPIKTPVKPFNNTRFQHGVKHPSVNAISQGLVHSQNTAIAPKASFRFFKVILAFHLL